METRRNPKNGEKDPVVTFLSGKFKVNVAANKNDVIRALSDLTGDKPKDGSDQPVSCRSFKRTL